MGLCQVEEAWIGGNLPERRDQKLRIGHRLVFEVQLNAAKIAPQGELVILYRVFEHGNVTLRIGVKVYSTD